MIRSRFCIQFCVHPKLARVVPQFLRKPPADPEKIRLLQEEIESMMEKCAIEPVSSHHPKGGYYSQLFLVQKKSRGWIPVIHLSGLNQYIPTPHFKMETIDSVCLALWKNDWAISVDLKDAYYHILIHRKSRRYLRFHFMGRTYQLQVLAFGLSPAPYVFTRVVKMVALSSPGNEFACIPGGLAPTFNLPVPIHSTQGSVTVDRFEPGICPELGQIRANSQSKVLFPGCSIGSGEGMIGPSLDRILRLQMIVQKMLASHSASAWEVHSLLEQMESVAHLLPYGRAHKRLLQWHVKDQWSQATQSWDYHFSLGPWFRQAVEQWLNKGFLHAMVLLVHPQPDFYLFTDASLVG